MSYTSLMEFIDGLVSEGVSLDRDLFELFLDHVKNVGSTVGFGGQQLDETYRRLLKLKINSTQMRTVTHYMIPQKVVFQETVDYIISWCFSHTKQVHYRRIMKPIIKWIIALIATDIFPAKNMKHCLNVLLVLLNVAEVHEDVCYLIYLIMDYDLVTEHTLKRLINAKKTRTIPPILSLCKRFKPHLLVNHLIIENEMKQFPYISKQLIENICLWTGNPKKEIPTKTTFPEWFPRAIAFHNKRRNQIRYQAEMPLAESFREAKEWGFYYEGTSFDSLLANRYGFIYIVLCGEDFQDITMKYIRRTLLTVEGNLNNPEEEATETFLRHVSELQRFTQQAILPAHNFLLENFKYWEGKSYRKAITGLLSGMVICPYKKFFPEIMKPIYELFLQKDFDLNCSLLSSLAKLLCNNVKYLSSDPVLSSCPPPKPTKEDILYVQKCFKHFCILFINMNKENCRILHEIVDHHILLSTLQTDVEINCLLPVGIFHLILINSDYILINEVAKLIMKKYETSTKESGLSKELATQMSDVQEILFGDILKSSAFRDSRDCPNLTNQILKFRRIKNHFRMTNSLMFLEANHIVDEEWRKEISDLKELKRWLVQVCPDLMRLLKALAQT